MEVEDLRPFFTSYESSSPESLDFDDLLDLETGDSVFFEVVKCPFAFLCSGAGRAGKKGAFLKNLSRGIRSRDKLS